MSEFLSGNSRYAKPAPDFKELEGVYDSWTRVWVKFLKGAIIPADYATSFTPVTVSNEGTATLYESSNHSLVFIDRYGNIFQEFLEAVNYNQTYASLLGRYRAFYGGSSYGVLTTNIDVYDRATLLQTINFSYDFPMNYGTTAIVFSPNGKYFCVSSKTMFQTNNPYNWVVLYSADPTEAITPAPIEFDGKTLLDRNNDNITQYVMNFMGSAATNIKIRVNDPNNYLDACTIQDINGTYANCLNTWSTNPISWNNGGSMSQTWGPYSFIGVLGYLDASALFPGHTCARFAVDVTCTGNGQNQSFSSVLAVYLNSA